MIVAAAFCPHPPALLPQLAQGAAGELAHVRAAALDAVRAVAGAGRPVLVLGAGPCDKHFPPGAAGSMVGFGVDVGAALGTGESTPEPTLPLSLTVGAWLLAEALGGPAVARAWSVAPEGTVTGRDRLVRAIGEWAETDCALLVMGDGSARRSTTAPGYFDERAAPFDAAVAAALAAGDPAALAALDPVLGAELLAAGPPAWHVAAAVLDTPRGGHTHYEASLLVDDAPYGVGYFVATWRHAAAATP